jgi:hypothetical protein
MQLATAAKLATDYVRTNLTYINGLVTGATNNGTKFIIVDGVFMDDTMADQLISLGYNVTVAYFDMGTYPRYVIGFDSPGPTVEEYHILNEYGDILMTENSDNINKE